MSDTLAHPDQAANCDTNDRELPPQHTHQTPTPPLTHTLHTYQTDISSPHLHRTVGCQVLLWKNKASALTPKNSVSVYVCVCVCVCA